MRIAHKQLILSLAAAGLISLSGISAATPVLLNNAQMDQIVAGAVFTVTETVVTTTTQNYQGNDPTQPTTKSAGPGVWQGETTTTTTVTQTMDCRGNSINSCYAPDQPNGLNPNTVVTIIDSSSTTEVGRLTKTWR